MASTFVEDIMKKNVITIDEAESIQEAAQKMLTANVGCVIVTRKDNPVGIITERDFVTKSLSVIIPTGTSFLVTITHPIFASVII